MGRLKKEKEPKICPICGKEYYSPWKTCSKECGNKARGLKLVKKARELREAEEKKYLEKPNHCRCCNKKLSYRDRLKTFCNSSCAATYNNQQKLRKPWSEEKRKAFSERQLERKGSLPLDQRDYRCKYCGEKITYNPEKSKLWHTVCRACRPYSKFGKLYERLGIQGKSLQEKNQNLANLFKKLYIEEGHSVPWIATKFNLYYESIRRFFKENKIQERSISEAIQNSIFRGVRQTIIEDPKYKHGYHTSWEGKRFWYRSSYELEFAQMLDEQRVRYEIESKSCRIYYTDPVDSKKHVAVPDFYLPDTNELVEVKSTFTLGNKDTMKARLQAFKDSGYIPKLWLDKKFVDINNF